MKKRKSDVAVDLLLPVIQAVLVTLKATGAVDWSWWWILAPAWGSFAVIALGVVVILITAKCE